MVLFIDARIPVVFGNAPETGDAVLAPVPEWDAAHESGCACCAARGPAAVALDLLFLGRVRGTIPWFTRVMVPAAGAAAIKAAIEGDAVVAGRFRLG